MPEYQIRTQRPPINQSATDWAPVGGADCEADKTRKPRSFAGGLTVTGNWAPPRWHKAIGPSRRGGEIIRYFNYKKGRGTRTRREEGAGHSI